MSYRLHDDRSSSLIRAQCSNDIKQDYSHKMLPLQCDKADSVHGSQPAACARASESDPVGDRTKGENGIIACSNQETPLLVRTSCLIVRRICDTLDRLAHRVN